MANEGKANHTRPTKSRTEPRSARSKPNRRISRKVASAARAASEAGRPLGLGRPASVEQSDDTPDVWIKLSEPQISRVIRAMDEYGGTSLSAALTELRQSVFKAYTPEWLSDRASQVGGKSISRQLLQGLVLLSCFPTDESYVSNEEIARMLDIGPTRTHRIISTFVAVGFLERDPVSRRYRRRPE